MQEEEERGAEEEAQEEEDGGRARVRSKELFGEWQTEAWAPPAVVDGKVPVNAHGNWELWTPAHLPEGAEHLDAPRAAEVAAALGIHYARAFLGSGPRLPPAAPAARRARCVPRDAALRAWALAWGRAVSR
jgi:hypothetical protein